MKSIIFLDIDGVLIADHDYQQHGFRNFSVACVENLQLIIDQVPGVRFVISSSWRKGNGYQELLKLWTANRLPGELIVDRTPVLEEATRGEEIALWLRQHQSHYAVGIYAVLDDVIEELTPFLPGECLFRCHHHTGLTPKIAVKVIAHLTRPRHEIEH